MKNILTKNILLAGCVLGLLLLCGCVKNTEELNRPSHKDKYSRSLVLDVKQSTTRAAVAEEAISRLDILIFKNDILEKTVLNINSFEELNGKNMVEVGVESEGVRDIYMVANADSEEWIKTLTPGVTTATDLWRAETGILTQMANPPLVMYSITYKVNFGALENEVYCSMYRAVGRIEVVNQADNFILKSARLIQSRSASKIFPSEPSQSKLKDFEAQEIAGDRIILYSYESLPEDGTTVEITGEADGRTLTYTVDFSANGEAVAIDRNHLYTVNINNALQSTLNISITVKPWLSGGNIDHVVGGNTPQTDILLEEQVGTSNPIDSTVNITTDGGNLTLRVKANAECGIELNAPWMTLQPQSRAAASTISSDFTVTFLPNGTAEQRTGSILIFNKLNPELKNIFTVHQAPGDDGTTKYLVIAVAGQSNAVGFDESSVDPKGKDAPIPEAFQLSFRTGGKNMEIVPLSWCADNINELTTINISGLRGLKGIHLPLAKELMKRVRSGYKLLFVNVAFGGSTFVSSSGSASTVYLANEMRPQEMNRSLKWGVGSPYHRTLTDRVKYALNLNPQNKFLGVVWCQGESDAFQDEKHHEAFSNMAQAFFDEINRAGYGARCPKGEADKDLWYTYSAPKYWVDWYGPRDAGGVFGGYKVWNPNTFIHIPSATHDNTVGGAGITGDGRLHFGNDSYAKVIAPAVVQCMDENGGLFNGNRPLGERFNRNITPAYANQHGGSMGDPDVVNSLVLWVPFKTSLNAAPGGTARIFGSGVTLSPAEGLVNINGHARTSQAATFTPNNKLTISGIPNSSEFSIAFMLKRTGDLGESVQTVIANNGVATAPFIGFRSYRANERTAFMSEFVCEPLTSGNRAKAVPGRFLEADNVAAMTQWIHYVVTYHHPSKQCIIYMNGQEVNRVTMPNTSALAITKLILGDNGARYPGFNGQLSDLCIWNKVITPAVIQKVFLSSYFDYSK